MSLIVNIMLFLNFFVLGRLISIDSSADDIHDIFRDMTIVSILNVIAFSAVHLVSLQ